MAPEQIQGHEIDHRVDIWAICVVLYEAIAGKPAFPGEGLGALCNVLEATVTPLEDTGGGEHDLFLVLSRGLEKDPAARFHSMHDLGNALAQWLYDRGQREDLSGTRISRSWQITTDPSDVSSDVASVEIPTQMSATAE
jgi:serine/threonine-protein kinase